MSKDVNEAVDNRIEQAIAQAFEILATFLDTGISPEQAARNVAQVYRNLAEIVTPGTPEGS